MFFVLFQIKPPHDKNIQKSILEHLKPENDSAFNENLSEFDGSLLFDPREEMCNDYYGMLCRFEQLLIRQNFPRIRFDFID